MRYNKVLCIIFYGANYYNKYNNYRKLERFVVLFRRTCQLSEAMGIPRSPASTALRGISIAALPLPRTFNYHNKLVILDAMIHGQQDISGYTEKSNISLALPFNLR